MDLTNLKEVSVHLPFDAITNARDLAGIEAEQGKVIRAEKLIRSAKLSKASELDRQTLSNMHVTDIVDLRTEWERTTEHDRHIEGAKHIPNPVFDEHDLKKAAGSNEKLVEMAALDSRTLMNATYSNMVTSPDAIHAWKKFFQVLKDAEGGVLWHCTQGKDRTGMAAALIEHALGVDEALIHDDYLQTNLYMDTPQAHRERIMASKLFSHDKPIADEDISTYLYAHDSYYDAMNKAIEENYGSWDAYLREAIGLEDADFDYLKEKYLV